jgi:hypothetical protein
MASSRLRHVWPLLRSPSTEWKKIAEEPDAATKVFWRYGAVLGAIAPVCQVAGALFQSDGDTTRPLQSILMDAASYYLWASLGLNLAFAYCTFQISKMVRAPATWEKAMKVAIYSQTGMFLLGVLNIVSIKPGPVLFNMGLLVIAVLALTIFILRKGLMIVMDVPQKRATGLTIALSLVFFVLVLAMSGLTALTSSLAGDKGDRNPPLVAATRAAELAGLKSPYASFGSEATSSDLTVLVPNEDLRARMRQGAVAQAAAYWPAGSTSSEQIFTRFNRPVVDCPPAPQDTEVCTFTFSARSTPSSSSELGSEILGKQVAMKIMKELSPGDLQAANASYEEGASGVVTVRLDIDDGATPYIEPRIDVSRPLLARGDATPRRVFSNNPVSFGALGEQTIVCRADAPAVAGWERRTCTIEFGPYQLTVGRDAPFSAEAPFENAEDDPVLMAELHDAATLSIKIVGGDPILERALEPIRAGNDTTAAFEHLVARDAGKADDTSEVRKRVADDAPVLRWHDVATQREFDLVCAEAATEGRPLLIYSTGRNELQRVLYQDAMLPFKSEALLVLVRRSPPAGENAWAKAFTAAMGADEWPTLTVTDKPRVANGACVPGKVLQAHDTDIQVDDVQTAVVTGRPPKARARPNQQS